MEHGKTIGDLYEDIVNAVRKEKYTDALQMVRDLRDELYARGSILLANNLAELETELSLLSFGEKVTEGGAR